MMKHVLKSLIREELLRLSEFAPGKFAANTFADVEVKNKTMSDIEVSKALDNALKGRHASGRPFSSQFRSSLHESASPNFDSDFGKILHEMNGRVPNSWNREFPYLYMYKAGQISLEEYSIIKSIMLFTKASVATIRDPEKFDSNQAKITGSQVFLNKIVPTKNDYQIANKIMTKLSVSKNYSEPDSIFRGIVVDKSIGDNLRPFIEFNNWPISSFTLDVSITWNFITANLSSDKIPVLIEINNPSHGSDISQFSYYRNESEVVLGKRLLIKNVDKNDDRTHLECDIIP
jgi:hypothetical protein